MAYDWLPELPALVARAAAEMPAEYPGGVDQWIADQINAMTVETRSEYRVTYRAVLAATKDPSRTEAFRAAIKATLPTIDEMLSSYGQEGGIDVAFPETRAFIQSKVGTGASDLLQAHADAICGLGLATALKYSRDHGPVSASEVALARRQT
jgi:hypothetical protein